MWNKAHRTANSKINVILFPTVVSSTNHIEFWYWSWSNSSNFSTWISIFSRASSWYFWRAPSPHAYIRFPASVEVGIKSILERLHSSEVKTVLSLWYVYCWWKWIYEICNPVFSVCVYSLHMTFSACTRLKYRKIIIESSCVFKQTSHCQNIFYFSLCARLDFL